MKKLGILAAFCCLSASSLLMAASPPKAELPQKQKFVPFEVIVKFKNNTKLATLKSEMKDVDIRSPSRHFSIARINVPSPKLYRPDEAEIETLALLKRMRLRKDVEYAQLDYLFDLSFTPNDPHYPKQWHYGNISLPQAWDITRGSSSVKIAILDSGRTTNIDTSSGNPVVTEHPDLDQKYIGTEYNAVSPGSAAIDNSTWHHGTHVAGIAAAMSNNGVGGAGVCQGCQLLNVLVFNTASPQVTPQGRASWISAGIDWATDNGADVINMSFELQLACTTTEMSVLRNAIARATNRGVVVVAAAGNGNKEVDGVSPASCPGVISTASTDSNNNRSAWSNFGQNIGITAPGGGGIVNTIPNGMYGRGVDCPASTISEFGQNELGAFSTWTTNSGSFHCYRFLSGTSMAAPHVAGTAGLMLSVNSFLRPDQISSIIKTTATALPTCGTNCGPGLLNAYAAVNKALITSTGPCSADDGSNNNGCTLDSIGQYVYSGSGMVESVYAYGYVWQLNAAGAQTGKAKKLVGIPRYANGPCVYTPQGEQCKFDSVTTLNYPGFGYTESITAYGRYWNFDSSGNPISGSGALLTSVARYANGPCAGIGSATCRFDTRTLIDVPEWGGLTESITAYGRFWNFGPNGNLTGTNTLVSVDRYLNGPCAFAPPGQACTFDSRELRKSGTGRIETVTAYGRFFEWGVNGQPTPASGVLLNTIPRFR